METSEKNLDRDSNFYEQMDEQKKRYKQSLSKTIC